MLGTTNASASQASLNNLSISINGIQRLTYNGKNAASLDITLASLGGAAANHTHDYLPLTGGTLSGVLYANGGVRIINPTPYIDFHFNNSPTYTSNIYEFAAGWLQFNKNFVTIRDQGSYNTGWFHIHNGELNMYFENNTVFTRNLIWKNTTTNQFIYVSDFGFANPKWSGYRIQRYADNSTIDTYKCIEDVYTHEGNLARCNNINLPNFGPMYFSEPNKYIYGDIGGWLRLGYNTYITGHLHIYGNANVINSYYHQDNNIGGIVAMQATGPNIKMLWAW